LLLNSYFVCEKTDGIRYLLYVTADGDDQEAVYLIDRKNDYWFIAERNIHFPRKDAEREDAFVSGTLLDGELVMDEAVDEQGHKYKEPKYLIFDVLALGGKVMMNRTLDKRIAYIQDSLMAPYKALLKKYPQEVPMQAFKVEMKQMEFSYGIQRMFETILPNLKHGNDGLIFTCRETQYHPGTDEHILKWKPVDENSIDLRLALQFPVVQPDEEEQRSGIADSFTDYEGKPRAKLYKFTGGSSGGRGFVPGDPQSPYDFFADLYLTEEEWETLKGLGDPLHGRIVECVLDDQKRWRLARFRDDKHEANHRSTVDSVVESILDSVSQQELLNSADDIRNHWKSRH
jgi:mRNA guanylyltransferase